MFESPVGVCLVPNDTYWRRLCESQVFIKLLSMSDSEASPWRTIPDPSFHTALGKLKSPIRRMSGTGLPRSRIVEFIFSMMMLLKDCSKGGP